MKFYSIAALVALTLGSQAYAADEVVVPTDFAFAGQYSAAGFSISIDANRHIEISNGAYAYSRPMLKDDELSFHATGYFRASNGCDVPVETTLDFSAAGDSVDVEFSKPNTVVRGPFGGCSFFGPQLSRFHLVKSTTTPGKSWIRNLQAQGCGSFGAQKNLNSQFASLTSQCQQQGGAAATSQRMAQCGPVDPNDLSCSFGVCSIAGQLTCTIP